MQFVSPAAEAVVLRCCATQLSLYSRRFLNSLVRDLLPNNMSSIPNISRRELHEDTPFPIVWLHHFFPLNAEISSSLCLTNFNGETRLDQDTQEHTEYI